MDSFLANAASIMAAAKSVRAAGGEADSVTILVSGNRGVRVISESDWPLDRVASFHGADMAYRVTRGESGVKLEGVASGRTCMLEAGLPSRAAEAKRLLTPAVQTD